MAEQIISTEFSTEMQQSFINYAMSVITDRAVPDVRDGLKPVQRRVLYTMYELGLDSDKPHRKSARIVGDAMGKYHPHGDSSVYDALVVMAQDFKKNMPLVDGHGNFGSIEGDGAAAMRYTEARLKKYTQDVALADLDKNVVDFVPNFDETEKEPTVLPMRVPNLLVNGSDGIAVGMTTSVPPHNLGEVIDGVILLLDHPDITTKDLMSVIKGPDFPTGGIVTNEEELLSVYETGRGRIRVRGKAEIVRAKRKSDRDQIVITEIPYPMIGANIGKFLSDVATLADSRKLPDIADISNQSSKEGIRIVIEVKKGGDPEKVLKGLYKKTRLEDTFGVSMLVIADGKPEIMGLKEILSQHIRFQEEINTRKYQTLLAREKDKCEVQEGLIKAVDLIDLIIEIIRGSRDLKTAKDCLMHGNTDNVTFKSKASKKQASSLSFTERQANAILELRLERLIGLEIMALQKEHEETLKKIASYEKILGSRQAMDQSIREDLLKIKKEYAVKRKTKICTMKEEVYEEEPVPEMPVVFSMNRFGYVKLYDENIFARNESAVREESRTLIFCKNTSKILLFTKEGTFHSLFLNSLSFNRPKDKGTPVDNLCHFDSAKETILFVAAAEEIAGKDLLFVTESGLVKRVPGAEFDMTKRTAAATKLAENDRLAAILAAEKRHVLLLSENRRLLRFPMSDIPEQKRTSSGVHGLKLDEGDQIIGAYQLNPKDELAVTLDDKRYLLSKARLKKRDARPELAKPET